MKWRHKHFIDVGTSISYETSLKWGESRWGNSYGSDPHNYLIINYTCLFFIIFFHPGLNFLFFNFDPRWKTFSVGKEAVSWEASNLCLPLCFFKPTDHLQNENPTTSHTTNHFYQPLWIWFTTWRFKGGRRRGRGSGSRRGTSKSGTHPGGTPKHLRLEGIAGTRRWVVSCWVTPLGSTSNMLVKEYDT